jgi:hypothetical protein
MGEMRQPGGRPRKFTEPSRPVTVTLPERTLDQLRTVDADRALAIVKAVDAVTGGTGKNVLTVDVVEVAPGISVIVIPPTRSLRSIPWLKTIEVAPARHLITIEPGVPIEKIEVAIIDLIEVAKSDVPEEVPTLEALREKMGSLRRRERISKAEILFVAPDRAS